MLFDDAESAHRCIEALERIGRLKRFGQAFESLEAEVSLAVIIQAFPS